MKTIKINTAEGRAEDHFLIKRLQNTYNVVISDEPDYLICSVGGLAHLKYENAIKIFYTAESQVGDFNLFDYVIGFDYIEFGDRYLRYPFSLVGRGNVELAIARGGANSILSNEKGFCSFVFSNPKADTYRVEFYNKLSEYKQIASGGRTLNNVGYNVKDKIEFESQYKFHLVIENSSYPGYVTEKIMDSFSAGGIPIYHGDPLIDREFNTNAFIWLDQYSSWNEAIEAIKEVDNNQTMFNKIISEPIFKDAEYVKKKNRELDAFLKNIFDQPKESGFRRNTSFQGKCYQGFFERYAWIDNSLRKVRDTYGKIIFKKRIKKRQ